MPKRLLPGEERSETSFSISCQRKLFEDFEDERASENKTRTAKIRELMVGYLKKRRGKYDYKERQKKKNN